MARKKSAGLPTFKFGEDVDLDELPSGRGVRSNPIVEEICQAILADVDADPVAAGKARPFLPGELKNAHSNWRNLLLRVQRRMVKYIKTKRTPLQEVRFRREGAEPVLYLIGKSK